MLTLDNLSNITSWFLAYGFTLCLRPPKSKQEALQAQLFHLKCVEAFISKRQSNGGCNVSKADKSECQQRNCGMRHHISSEQNRGGSMWMENENRPSIEPWGTPQERGAEEEDTVTQADSKASVRQISPKPIQCNVFNANTVFQEEMSPWLIRDH